MNRSIFLARLPSISIERIRNYFAIETLSLSRADYLVEERKTISRPWNFLNGSRAKSIRRQLSKFGFVGQIFRVIRVEYLLGSDLREISRFSQRWSLFVFETEKVLPYRFVPLSFTRFIVAVSMCARRWIYEKPRAALESRRLINRGRESIDSERAITRPQGNRTMSAYVAGTVIFYHFFFLLFTTVVSRAPPVTQPS